MSLQVSAERMLAGPEMHMHLDYGRKFLLSILFFLHKLVIRRTPTLTLLLHSNWCVVWEKQQKVGCGRVT
jgi:hypothetical protein